MKPTWKESAVLLNWETPRWDTLSTWVWGLLPASAPRSNKKWPVYKGCLSQAWDFKGSLGSWGLSGKKPAACLEVCFSLRFSVTSTRERVGWLWMVGHSRTVQTYHRCLWFHSCKVLRTQCLGTSLRFEHLNSPGKFWAKPSHAWAPAATCPRRQLLVAEGAN